MPNKLILKVYKTEPRTGEQNVVRIDQKAMDILTELQRSTGLPLRQIASKLIVYASDYVEIEE